MYSIQYYGKFFNYHHVTTIGILVVLTALITCCDACPSRRTPPRTRPIKKEPGTSASPTVNSSPSGSASSTGENEPPENNTLCFSTTIGNLTNNTIKTNLEKIAASGTLSRLFTNNMDEQNVFLKGMKPNDTSCSNIQGYMIEITLRTNKTYHHAIKQLNQSSAKKSCERARNCRPVSAVLNLITTEPNTTEATSIPTKENTRKQTTKGQGEGTNAAGKSDNDGVSFTTIVIPLTLVVTLVIVIIVLVFWCKRRSTKKGYKDEQTQNSVDHVTGPVNGDVYTVVNPSAEKKKNGKGDNNDLVYTEMSHMKSGKSVNEHPAESDQTEYADITHILRAGETTYGNVTPQNDEKEAYANVVTLQ
ncbi:Hypothetical predicted protein [Paramuricea clavata]|uniref:Uncharacterized protein n=1 Tax=Paramuricea clavata TaxID=317549 RepID=A0A7D9H6R4_PARCT|nr:Hypothetical predicted protein [Paramuricea clavata]